MEGLFLLLSTQRIACLGTLAAENGEVKQPLLSFLGEMHDRLNDLSLYPPN